MEKIDDFFKYSVLFSYYKTLFSTKQKAYLEMYFEEDYSLSEIANEFNISRQAIYDNIKRGVNSLDSYENKLSLYEKDKILKTKFQELKNNFSQDQFEKIVKDLGFEEVL